MLNLYEKYWKEKTSDELNDFKYKWQVISKVLPKNKRVLFLDYGCGTGRILKEVKKLNPLSKFAGVDISTTALKKVRTTFPKDRFHLTSDGKPLPFKNNEVDYILALDVIEHVVNTEILLSEFNRVLKPGGKILISTPYHGVIKNLTISLVGFETVFNPSGPHIRFFTLNSLTRMMNQFKFKILSVGYYGRFFPLWRGMYVEAQKSNKSQTKF